MGLEGSEPKPLPHYALPNFSVVLPTYSNNESDVITQAFRVGNFVTLGGLPNSMKPGQVSRSRFQKILDNRQPAEDWNVNLDQGYKPKAKSFGEFEYMSTPFSLADDLARLDREKSQKAMAAAGHPKAWVMSDQAVKLKHEDIAGVHANPEMTFSAYTSTADPYERADDQALRYKWLQDAQILSGPFRPSGRVKGSTGQASSELPSRTTLPAMVAELREAIELDWAEYASPHAPLSSHPSRHAHTRFPPPTLLRPPLLLSHTRYPFLVCSTDDEHIVIRFELATLDSEPGLGAYMNVFSRSEHVVTKFMLKKVVEDWNVTPGDGHLYFTFRPPWVASKITDTFYALHPEQRNFQDSKLKGPMPSATKSAKGGFTESFGASDIGATAASMLASVQASTAGGATGDVSRPQMA